MKNGGAKMIESWKVDSNKLMKKMNVTEKGLSDEQVLQIREKVGENLLEEAKKKGISKNALILIVLNDWIQEQEKEHVLE